CHFSFSSYRAPRHLHSFPTRRSSDLANFPWNPTDCDNYNGFAASNGVLFPGNSVRINDITDGTTHTIMIGEQSDWGNSGTDPLRSEGHTSELQSPYDLVCRLLLEKKK